MMSDDADVDDVDDDPAGGEITSIDGHRISSFSRASQVNLYLAEL